MGLKALPLAPSYMQASGGEEQAGRNSLALAVVGGDSWLRSVYRGGKMRYGAAHPRHPGVLLYLKLITAGPVCLRTES